jgi:hypothetical protein
MLLPFEGSEGQEERERAAGKRLKSPEPVEGDRIFILRLHDDCKGLHVSFENPERRVGKQRAAESLVTKALVDSKTADQRGRQHRIAREAFANVHRKIVGGNARRRERVEAGNPVRRRLHGDKAARHQPLYILRGLFTQIPVERRRAAGEVRTIMGAERLDDERVLHRDPLISSR